MSEWEVFLRVKPRHKLCSPSLTVRFYATYRAKPNHFRDIPHSRNDILNWPRNSVCSTAWACLRKCLHLCKTGETAGHTNFVANLECLTAKKTITRNLLSLTIKLTAMTLLKARPKRETRFRKNVFPIAFSVILHTTLV